MSLIKRVLMIPVILSFIFIFGCEKHFKEKGSADERVVAKINSYELTVADFKEGANMALLKKYSSYSPIREKEDLLEQLILKEVLLQEAQRLNLDKEKSFMKEIEGYWEQALLKFVINKRIGELSVNISVSDKEVLDEYARLKRRISAELVIFSDKLEAQILSQATTNFNEVKESLKGRIFSDVPADWYTSRDLPPKLEDVLFSLKTGEVSPPVEYNNDWVVIRVLNQEDRPTESLEELKPRIREGLIRIKKEEVLEGWCAELRKKASVKVNKEVLKEIDLK